jgi:hypothetical protein
VGCLLAFLVIFGGIAAFTWCFLLPSTYETTKHHLYSSFDSSPPHKKLITDLSKTKLAIVVGLKENGLRHFMEHYANKVSQNQRTLYFERLNPND